MYMIDLVKYISLSVNSIFDEIDYGLFHMEGLDRKKTTRHLQHVYNHHLSITDLVGVIK